MESRVPFDQSVPDVPAGASPAESPDEAERERRIRRLERLAYVLDSRFTIPGLGWRFGVDGLIGLIPGIGDFASTAIGAYIVAEAVRFDVPAGKIARMIGNLAADGILASVPVVGDIFDFAFKAHRMNVHILLEHLGRTPRL
jgi:hypothetical protein